MALVFFATSVQNSFFSTVLLPYIGVCVFFLAKHCVTQPLPELTKQSESLQKRGFENFLVDRKDVTSLQRSTFLHTLDISRALKSWLQLKCADNSCSDIPREWSHQTSSQMMSHKALIFVWTFLMAFSRLALFIRNTRLRLYYAEWSSIIFLPSLTKNKIAFIAKQYG